MLFNGPEHSSSLIWPLVFNISVEERKKKKTQSNGKTTLNGSLGTAFAKIRVSDS